MAAARKARTPDALRRGELQIAKQRNRHDQGESHLVIAADEAAFGPLDVVEAPPWVMVKMPPLIP